MNYLPVMLDLADKKILLIGAGKVGLEKAEKLIHFGGRITVVSLAFLEQFYHMAEATLLHEAYAHHHLDGAFLVIVATNDRVLNREIFQECRRRGQLCNVVDDAALSDVIFSAALKRGDLIISAGTGGNSPFLAKRIIKDLAQRYDESYGEKVALLGKIRSRLMKEVPDVATRRAILKEIIEWDNEELAAYYEMVLGGVNA